MDELKWWQRAVFYQIYPRSFSDSNGDGIGDFPGITAWLDYLAELGIDAIWLSPHYPSPFLDCGYDICDYKGVGLEYGSLGDFTTFLGEAHARGIRVILDLVLNHTSSQHTWFLESRSSRDNPKRDWYIWRDPRGDGPPNNWASIFGGSAWEFDRSTGQYYYHAFLKEQPDLNWRNPVVKRAMWEAVRFWLDLGVDGFRLDAIATIFENPDLPDHTLPLSTDEILDVNALDRKSYEQLLRFQLHQPGTHELMRELRALLNEYPGDRVLVGEDEDVAYHGTGDDELHLLFNFPLMRVQRLTPTHIRSNQAIRISELPPGAWPCNTLGNHDSPRVWSRYGDGVHNSQLARVHLALVLTLKGTPFLYYGEEIGMTDLQLTDLSQFRDTAALRQYRIMTEKHGVPHEEALKVAAATTRDRCRSPMQWSSAPNAGFSPPDSHAWLPINSDCFEGVNVVAQQDDENSLLNFYRRMLHLRKETPALIAGDYHALRPESDAYFAFLRHDMGTGQTCLITLSFSHEKETAVLHAGGLIDGLGDKQARLLFSSHPREDRQLSLDWVDLEPFEVLLIELV